ncbi:MAG: PilN domain-containing protein [Clostridiaceae bacterium]|nr:PilN domain-containing protein [Clostridiaceae bacterium]
MIAKDINLLPYRIIKQRKSRDRTKLIILLSVLIAETTFSLLLIPYNEIVQLEARKRYLEDSITKIGNVEDIEKEIQLEQRKLDMRQAVLSVVEQEDYDILAVLEQTEELMPGEVFFLSLTTSRSGVTIAGIAENELVVAELIRNMKKVPFFEKVFVPSITERGSGSSGDLETKGVSFIMNCTFKAGKDN